MAPMKLNNSNPNTNPNRNPTECYRFTVCSEYMPLISMYAYDGFF